MMVTIARKEFKERLQDGRFRLMAGIALALLLVALAAGWKYYAQTQAESGADRSARYLAGKEFMKDREFIYVI